MKNILKTLLIILAATIILFSLMLIIFYQPDISVDALRKKYANNESQFVTLLDMPVHFRDEGNPEDSIPLVLLHGTSSSLLTWDACAQIWKLQHRVVRMDLFAFGLTGPNPINDYSLDQYVVFLHAFLEQRGIKQCYLAGNSLGGLIAVYYAQIYPDQIKKLILIDPAGYPIENAKGSLGFTLARIPVLNKLLTIVTPKSIVRKSIEDVYGNKALVSEALIEQYHDLTCRAGNRQALLVHLNADQQIDTTMVSKIKQPTMIIWGDLDQLIPVANAYKFHRDLLNDTLVILPNVGHVPMEETPEKVMMLVNDFIKE